MSFGGKFKKRRLEMGLTQKAHTRWARYRIETIIL
jgi:hypothetical protein